MEKKDKRDSNQSTHDHHTQDPRLSRPPNSPTPMTFPEKEKTAQIFSSLYSFGQQTFTGAIHMPLTALGA